MAQVNSRGTLTRGRWDYFEHSNGWASVYGSVVSGNIAAYFANNVSGTMQLDLYHLEWFASVSAVWAVQLLPPPLIITPLIPTESEIHPSQPDRASLAGVCGMWTAANTAFFTIQRISNQVNSGVLEPVRGEPFITLPPGWAISVGANVGTNPCELSLNVWYQETLDNVPPAP